MSIAVTLALALATAPVAAPPPSAPPPSDRQRLAIEGISVGDPEARLVTLMPTARCSDVEGDSGIADRWCRIPDQRVFGVLPQSLTVTLTDDRVDAVLARIPWRVWPLLRANLVEALGPPEERVVPVLPTDVGDDEETPLRAETLRWTRGGVRLGVASGADGSPLLSIQRAPSATLLDDE